MCWDAINIQSTLSLFRCCVFVNFRHLFFEVWKLAPTLQAMIIFTEIREYWGEYGNTSQRSRFVMKSSNLQKQLHFLFNLTDVFHRKKRKNPHLSIRSLSFLIETREWGGEETYWQINPWGRYLASYLVEQTTVRRWSTESSKQRNVGHVCYFFSFSNTDAISKLLGATIIS